MTLRAVLHETHVAGRRLGRHVAHDPRSRAHAAPTLPRAQIRSVSWPRLLPALDQGDLGCCTGAAAAGLMATEPFYDPSRTIDIQLARSLYSEATKLDHILGIWPPSDTGSSGLAVAKALKKRGWIKAYRHAFTMDAALSALQSAPVITGIPWYEGFDAPQGDRAVVDISGRIRGGHEVEVFGYDAVTNHVLLWQSWGPEWGDRGRFCMSVDTWQRLLDESGDVTVPVAA